MAARSRKQQAEFSGLSQFLKHLPFVMQDPLKSAEIPSPPALWDPRIGGSLDRTSRAVDECETASNASQSDTRSRCCMTEMLCTACPDFVPSMMCQGLGRMKTSRQSWADLNSDSEDEDYACACQKDGLVNFSA